MSLFAKPEPTIEQRLNEGLGSSTWAVAQFAITVNELEAADVILTKVIEDTTAEIERLREIRGTATVQRAKNQKVAARITELVS